MQRFETKFDLLHAAYRDDRLKKSAISLLQYLVHKSDKKTCFPAVQTIARDLNVCKRTVQYNMRKLEKAGYVIRKERWYHHNQLTNEYMFNLGVTTEQAKGKYDQRAHEIINASMKELSKDDREICKINEIRKTYAMALSGREKMLLSYLILRANRNGYVYEEIDVIMNAVGLREKALLKLIHLLREKKLLKVKSFSVAGSSLFLFKVTGRIWKKKQHQEEGFVTSEQEKNSVVRERSAEQNPGSCQKTELGQKEIFWKKCKSKLRKWKQEVISGFCKLLKILRI